MKKFHLLLTLILIAMGAVFLSGCGGSDSDVVVVNEKQKDTLGHSDEYDYKIYLITMDLADIFWTQIDEGCRQAVSEIGGINYKWLGPDVNTDDLQMVCIDQAVEEGVDALVIASSSKTGINPSLEKAAAKGVKLVFVDNPAEFEHVAFLATDNEAAGKVAGETLRKGLEQAGITEGTIALTANKDNVTSTELRIKGFRTAFEGTNFTLTDIFYMEDNDQSLKDYAAAHPEYIAFFGSNERTARNIGEQMRDSGSKQMVMGFDTSDSVLTLLYDGYLYATIQQNPQRMGHDGVDIAVKALKGEYKEINARIDTGVKVLYKEEV